MSGLDLAYFVPSRFMTCYLKTNIIEMQSRKDRVKKVDKKIERKRNDDFFQK